MKKIFENKIFVIVSLFLIFGAVTVIASTIGDSGFSGIQVDNYFAGSGKAGIGQNISFNDSEGNTHSLEFEDGLLVNYTFNGPSFPENGLMAYYRADETSGSILNDELKTYNLTGINSPTWNSSGLINGASHLNESSSQYWNGTTGDDLFFSYGEPYSINVWVKFDNVSAGDQFIVSKAADNTINYGRYHLRLFSSTGKLHYIAHENDTTEIIASTSTSPVENVWYMATIRYDGGTNMTIWLNGNLEGTKEITSYIENGEGPFKIGEQSGIVGSGNYLNGLFDELGVWNRSLTKQEIEDLCNNGNGLTY